jgi:Ca-activated chloride channel family protein
VADENERGGDDKRAPAERPPAPPTASHPPAPIPYGLIAVVFVPALAASLWFLRGVESFRFAHPYALALIPLAVAMVTWAGIRRAPARRAALVHSRAGELGARKRGLAARLRDLPVVLRLLVVVLTGVALARPQSAQRDDEIELEGIDIVVTLDLSGSMEETDLVPNRLEAAKAVIQDFVRRRRSDRIGLVTFARDAYTYIPLTLDHGTFLRMLGELHLGIIDGKGTAIGNGLGVALARLRRSDARSRVIILLTDGDSNAGNISPLQAAEYAKKLGVKIYTVLAGDNDSSDVPAAPGAARQRYPVNPKLLEQIATMTGGTPYLATDTRALARQFQNILEDLEKSRIRDRGVLYAELYPRFLWPAFLVLLLELALRLGRLRRLP